MHPYLSDEQWPSGSIVGYLLYYYAYSTWEGRYLFIEDIYVKPELRRFGIGSALWDTATKVIDPSVYLRVPLLVAFPFRSHSKTGYNESNGTC